MSEPNRERRRWPPLLWAALALPLWAAGAVLPAGIWRALGGASDPKQLPLEMLVLGICVATTMLLAIDRRIGPEGRPGWWAPTAFVSAAFVAGLGASILASELHNVLMAITGAPLNTQPPPNAAPITMALLGVVQPICLVIVLQGVVQRTFATIIPEKWAILATLGVGAFFGGGATTRVVPLLVLPGWIFAKGKALVPAIAALMPVGIVTALNALEIGPGIAGFDRTGVDAQWQPIWFNVMGAGLLVIGLRPLLKVWSKP